MGKCHFGDGWNYKTFAPNFIKTSQQGFLNCAALLRATAGAAKPPTSTSTPAAVAPLPQRVTSVERNKSAHSRSAVFVGLRYLLA